MKLLRPDGALALAAVSPDTRAKTKIGMANLVYNMRRLAWLTQVAPA